MSYELMAYEKARHDYVVAGHELKALIRTLSAAVRDLRVERLDIDPRAWPSFERMKRQVAKVRSIRQELRETWAAVPEGMRAGLQPPPEGAIRDGTLDCYGDAGVGASRSV